MSDQLKKLRAEEEDAAKSKGTSLKGEVDSEKECRLGKENWSLEQVPASGINCAGIPPRQGKKKIGKNYNVHWRMATLFGDVGAGVAWLGWVRPGSLRRKRRG